MRRKAEGRLQAIVAAAVTTFSRQGYAATQMADIARAAAVSVGTLYLYAASKEARFDAALAEATNAPPGESALPLPFRGWPDVAARAEGLLIGTARWPRLDAAVAARGRPSDAAVLAVAAELYDLIAANRRGLKLIDSCLRDIPELAGLYENDIRGRYLDAMERFAARRCGADKAPVLARAVVEMITWMAMHRHGDTRPIAADEAAIRQGTIDAAASILA